MKRTCMLYVLLALSVHLPAQHVDREISLQEVEVKAARVIRKADRQTIYPTEVQKNSSSSGYSILQKLALPNIRVDETSCSVSAVDGRGTVQLRINGIIVGRDEMLAADPSSVTRIDFIDNPGVRYGEGIVYVIDIRTRRDDEGYTAGVSLTNALTSKIGNDLVYGKWNRKKSEVSLSYSFGYKDFKGNRMSETADYRLNDGSTYAIRRNDITSRSRSFSNDLQLKYNLADSAGYVFQVSLGARFSHVPDNFNCKQVTDGDEAYIATQYKDDASLSPTLDLYFFKQLSARQSLTLSAVGTYISTSFESRYDEGSPYIYNVDGKTCSLTGEAVYENRFKPFSFTAGVNCMLKYTANTYSGDVTSSNPMHNRKAYAFAEIKGTAGPFSYVAGLGGSYLDYRQQEHSYCFWLFRPKVTVGYSPFRELQLKYDFQISEHVSQVAMISNTAVRNNSMEWTLGNPDIRPNSEQEHTFQVSYTRPRFQSFVQAYGKICRRPNMATYIPTSDNQFVYTQINQKEIDVLHLMLYANCWVVPEKLSLGASGTMFRCFNFGNDYTHCRTFYMGSANMQAYWGKFSFSAAFDSGWRFMEGETESFNGSFAQFSASYRHKDLNVSVSWQQPFAGLNRQFLSDVYNRYVRKTTMLHCPDLGNLVSVSISWRISKGRKFREIKRGIQPKVDTDAGILR